MGTSWRAGIPMTTGWKWGEAQTRARNDPNSFWVLFDTYRHPWPKYILMLLIILGEGGLILGVRRLLRPLANQGGSHRLVNKYHLTAIPRRSGGALDL